MSNEWAIKKNFADWIDIFDLKLYFSMFDFRHVHDLFWMV
jgi:hypothetical protein